MSAKKAIAFLLSFLCIFAFVMPSAYAASESTLWPTKEFTKGRPPLWFRPVPIELYLMYRGISDGNFFSDSVLTLHNGELVYERYALGWDADTPHQMYSVTKSVLSALTGIAIGDGKIKSVKDKVIDYLDVVIAPGQECKRDITIEHLLTQTSGLPGDGDAESDGYDWWLAADSGKTCFEIPQYTVPGERFSYSSGPGMQSLAALLTKAVGENLFEYAKRKLFKPLGMDSVKWDAAADGVNYGGFGLSMTPRDMARFGYLYLQGGEWDGKQIIPADYVAASPPPSMAGDFYGYLFWDAFDNIPIDDAYFAGGAFGQFIFIMPSQDTVLVRTGSAIRLAKLMSKAMLASDFANRLFMTVIYPLVPLKGVPLDYFMENL